MFFKLKLVLNFSKALLLTLMVVPTLSADPVNDPLGSNYLDLEAQARAEQNKEVVIVKDPANPLYSNVIRDGKAFSGTLPTQPTTPVLQGGKESGSTGDFTRGSANSSEATLLEQLKNQGGQTKTASQVNSLNQLNKVNQQKNNQQNQQQNKSNN